MSDDKPNLSIPYAILAWSIVLLFGGILIGQQVEPGWGHFLALALLGAAWLIGIGIYNIGKWVGRDE